MKTLLLLLAVLWVTGCQWLPGRGAIRAGGASVVGVKDAGSPATLATSNAGVSVPLPEGSKVTVTKYEGVPATTETPAIPAREVTEISPAGPTEYKQTESKLAADTGVIDTSVAKHRIDVADRRWLLWVAIGCGIGGVVLRSMLPAWGGLSNGLLIGGALAFGAWKLSDIPSWIWLVAIGVMGALALGYKRAELDANHDGIPDFLQRAKKPVTKEE